MPEVDTTVQYICIEAKITLLSTSKANSLLTRNITVERGGLKLQSKPT